MNKRDIHNLLVPDEREKVYIPNEIFNDLNAGKFNTVSNTAFAYTYYCLICYLYRYCKYVNGTFFTPNVLKEILGYVGNNKTLDFIVKKNGILDEMGYTETCRDFPVTYEIDDGMVNFHMYTELDSETKQFLNMPKNFKVKSPVKSFYRTEESKNDDAYDGTFYEIANTHLFDVNIFIDIVGDKRLGVVGFYFYQYIKHKNDVREEAYTVTHDKIREEMGMSHNTVSKYSQLLMEAGYMEVINNGFKEEGNYENKEMLPKSYKVIK